MRQNLLNSVTIKLNQCLHLKRLSSASPQTIPDECWYHNGPLRTFDFGKRAIKVCKCDGKVTLQYLSKTFSRSSKVTLPNIRKGLVNVTIPSQLQYLNGSLSKSLKSLKVYFRAVYHMQYKKNLLKYSRE